MSSDVLQQALAANQVAIFGRGRIFNLLQCAFPVNIAADYRGIGGGQTKHKVFNGTPAGSKFVSDPADGEWTYLRVTNGATPQNITIFVGSDDMSFNNAVTVTGVAQTQVAPSSAITDTPAVVTATGQHALFAANLTRRRVTVFADPANTATVYVRVAGGGNDIGFVQPGTFAEFDTTAALDYRDASAGAQKCYIFEES